MSRPILQQPIFGKWTNGMNIILSHRGIVDVCSIVLVDSEKDSRYILEGCVPCALPGVLLSALRLYSAQLSLLCYSEC